MADGFDFLIGVDPSSFEAGMSSALGRAQSSSAALSASVSKFSATQQRALDAAGISATKNMSKTSAASTRMGQSLTVSAQKSRVAIGGLDKTFRALPVTATKASATTSAAMRRLSGGMNAVSAAGGRGRNALGQFAAGAKGARSQASGLLGSVRGLVGGLGSFAGLGALFAVSEVVSFASAVDKANAEVSTLVDTSMVNVPQLTSEVRRMAAAFGIDGVQATKALYQAISSGVEPAKAVEFLADSSKLASAGLADLSKTTDVLTTVLNSYRLGADKAGVVSDILFQTVKAGRTTIPELSASLGKVAVIAAESGISLQEVSAATSSLTTVLPTTAQSVTALVSLIKGIKKPSSEAAEAARSIGVEFSASALESKGLSTFLGELRGALDSAGAQGRNTTEIMNALFTDQEAGLAATSLLGAQFRKFNEDLAATEGALGETDKAQAKVAATLSNKVNVAMQTVKTAAAEFGLEIADLVGDVVKLVQSNTDLGEAVRTVGSIMAFAANGPLKAVSAIVKALNGDFLGASKAGKQVEIQVLRLVKSLGKLLDNKFVKLLAFPVTASIDAVKGVGKFFGFDLGAEIGGALDDQVAALEQEIKDLSALEKTRDAAIASSQQAESSALAGSAGSVSEALGLTKRRAEDAGRAIENLDYKKVPENVEKAISSSRPPTASTSRLFDRATGDARVSREAASRLASRIVEATAREVPDKARMSIARTDPISSPVITKTFDLSSLAGVAAAQQSFVSSEQALRSRRVAGGAFVPLGQSDLLSPTALFNQQLRSSGLDIGSLLAKQGAGSTSTSVSNVNNFGGQTFQVPAGSAGDQVDAIAAELSRRMTLGQFP